MNRLYHIWRTHRSSHPWTSPGPHSTHARVENGRDGVWGQWWWWGGQTHRGCGQGCLANQVGVRDGHAEAQPRACLLHGRYRRLEVAGERRGGGGRGGGRVGGLRRKQKGGEIEKEEEKEVTVREVKERQRGKTGC